MLGTPLEKVFVGRRCWWVTNPKVSYLATYPRFYNGEYAQAMSDLRLFMSGKWNWIEIGPALLAFSIEMHWVDLSGAQYGLQGKTTFYPRWDLSVAGNQSVAVKWRLWNIILQKVSLCLEPKPKQESRFRPQLEFIFCYFSSCIPMLDILDQWVTRSGLRHPYGIYSGFYKLLSSSTCYVKPTW